MIAIKRRVIVEERKKISIWKVILLILLIIIAVKGYGWVKSYIALKNKIDIVSEAFPDYIVEYSGGTYIIVQINTAMGDEGVYNALKEGLPKLEEAIYVGDDLSLKVESGYGDGRGISIFIDLKDIPGANLDDASNLDELLEELNVRSSNIRRK